MERSLQQLNALYLDGRSLPGLASITGLMHALGDPQSRIRCIHVAGTNGKGSTCATMASVLQAAGYKVGFFPSPHLHTFCEYMQIDGHMISEEDLAHYAHRVLLACQRLTEEGHEHPTFFEVITACTYLYFTEQQVDIAVIETAMGGRLDCTNVITPILSVITQIGMDHVAVLGPRIDDIAKEKAGIIKDRVPVIMARQQYSLPQMVIRSVCQQKHCELIDVEAYPFEVVNRSLKGQTFETTIGNTPYTITTPLLGDHQVDNAMTALCAILELRRLGYTISDEALQEGYKAIHWAGRMEIAEHEGIHFLLDGAHNRQAAVALKEAIHRYLPDEKIILICGILTTKDAVGVSEAFASFSHYAVCTKPNNLRAMQPCELKNHYINHGTKSEAVDTAEDAVQRAITLAKAEGARWIVAAGSLYMLSDIKKALSK